MKILPPVLVLILLLAMGAAWYFLPAANLVPPPFSWGGALLLMAGLVMTVSEARRFRRINTNIMTFNDPGILVTEGLFRVSRNPMYLGFALFLTGVALLSGSIVALGLAALFVLIANAWYIPFEERALRRVFGESYEAYSRRVRRWL